LQEAVVTPHEPEVSHAPMDAAAIADLCEQPQSLQRDHEIFSGLQHIEPQEFFTAFTDSSGFAKRFENIPASLRSAVIEAAIERWLQIDPGALSHSLVRRNASETCFLTATKSLTVTILTRRPMLVGRSTQL
jgi:hypothetical protein